MSRMAARIDGAFSSEVARALALLGEGVGSRAADALVDPSGAARMIRGLAAGSSLLLRAAPELREEAKGYAALPADPAWARIARGSAEVAVAPLRVLGEATKATRAEVKAVAVRTREEPCCDGASCKLSRTAASVWLEVGDAGRGAGGASRWLVAEARDLEVEAALEAVRGVATALAGALGVPLEIDGKVAPEGAALGAGNDEGRGGEGGDKAFTAGDLARFAMRAEGDRIVLRDYASRGPRETARRTLFIGLVLLVLAVGLWALFGTRVREGDQGWSVALGAVAALVSLTAYAFLGVGRFAVSYAAASSPLVAMGRDRVIVAPWVSRRGEVDLRPEGRLGAAIPIGEVQGVAVLDRDGKKVVELATDHGPIDALESDDAEVAELLAEALRRSVDQVRHPGRGASAKQRARAKAGAA
jgi:hypothetical protein